MPKVAILGAGLSGLACAHRLRDFGVIPEVFEINDRVGDRPPFMEVILRLMNRPISDALMLLAEKFGLSLAPSSFLHTVFLHGPEIQTQLRGSLGYTTIRGNDGRAWERQLAVMLADVPMHFGVKADPEELARTHDFVVVANGNPDLVEEMGLWQTDVEVFLMGSHIKGRFTPGTVDVWMDTAVAKQGYVFRTPFDEWTAGVYLAASPTGAEEIEELWKRAVSKLRLNPVDGTALRVDAYRIGRVQAYREGKFLFVGTAGGYIDPFLGFGQVPALLSGINAAEFIVGKAELGTPLRWFHRAYEHGLRLREYVDSLDNEGFDRAVGALGSYLVRPLAMGTRVNAIALLSRLVQLRNMVK